jgi:hypothetical protein
MTFAMVLPLPSTSISAGTGFVCFLAHAGSASMASGLRAGGFPVKVMVPLIVDAAPAMPGQPITATSTATSHNLLPVTRMLVSLVMKNLESAAAVDVCFQYPRMGRTLYRARHRRNPCLQPPGHGFQRVQTVQADPPSDVLEGQ